VVVGIPGLVEGSTLHREVTSGRCDNRAWALLNSTERYINDHFGRREFSLNAEIVEVATDEFRKELETIFEVNARREALKGKVPLFLLGASTSL
jgi:hypothetical protein